MTLLRSMPYLLIYITKDNLLRKALMLTSLFTNMRILKFRSQQTIAFFAAVNHLNRPLRKQNFTSRVQKVMVCDLWISIRFVCFSVSRFLACDRNYDWRQRKTQLWRWLLNFRVRMHVCEKRIKAKVSIRAKLQLYLQYYFQCATILKIYYLSIKDYKIICSNTRG